MGNEGHKRMRPARAKALGIRIFTNCVRTLLPLQGVNECMPIKPGTPLRSAPGYVLIRLSACF